MKPFRAYFLLAFVLYLNTAYAQRAVSKGTLFIIGGGDRPHEMTVRMIEETHLADGGYALILPMSSSEPDTSIFYARQSFLIAGIQNVFGLSCTKADANSQPKADSVRNARLVYISGGDQSRFMDIVKGSKLEHAIREAYLNGAMIAGTSAGAAVMSEIMITGNQLKNSEYSSTFANIESENLETSRGLGLITNAMIDQHFVVRSRHNRLITAILEFPHMQGIGIDESTAILVKGNRAEVIGLSQVLVYSNLKNYVAVKNGKYGAKRLRLKIYLPGERFKI